jgi:hypothetical protein
MGTSSVNFSEFSVHRSILAKYVNGIREQNIAKAWTMKTALCSISHGAHARVGRLSFHLTSEMGPIGCSETSVSNYRYSLRNNPEERSSPLLRGGSLKSTLRPKFHSIVSMLWFTHKQSFTYNGSLLWLLLACVCSRPTCQYNGCVVYGMDAWTYWHQQ